MNMRVRVCVYGVVNEAVYMLACVLLHLLSGLVFVSRGGTRSGDITRTLHPTK